MKKIILALALCSFPLFADETPFEDNYFKQAAEPGAVMFNPPEGWFLADPKALPPSVKMMVVGKSKSSFPSMNLGMEAYNGSIKDYLRTIKAINDSQGAEWKDLGTIRTQAGNASLSQVDSKTEWGDVRMMHVILIKDSTVYILTAAALKDEFPNYYNDFFKSMRSLRFNKSLEEMIPSKDRQESYSQAIDNLKNAWLQWIALAINQEKNNSELFFNESFQLQYWQPFQTFIQEDYSDMGEEWRHKVLETLRVKLIGPKD